MSKGSARYRHSLRKRLEVWQSLGKPKDKKPKITRLNEDTISVFAEFNLRAQDHLSISFHIKKHLMEHPEEERSEGELTYLFNKGIRL